MISALCKYLILEHLSAGKPRPRRRRVTFLINVLRKAAKRFLKTSLDIKLLRFKRWIGITVCSLLAVIEVCGTDPYRVAPSPREFVLALGKLRPGKVTRELSATQRSRLQQLAVVSRRTACHLLQPMSLLIIQRVQRKHKDCSEQPHSRACRKFNYKRHCMRICVCPIFTTRSSLPEFSAFADICGLNARRVAYEILKKLPGSVKSRACLSF
ncbi:hypothetical protein DPEC_G00068310 [Dallia pectoralis]|uniref:Uncharacterized protein n=1 Tax=Dallia pectoralis TaxID=75939 RepID=A0ACC2H1J3_DALPE|nr:hypothetical protein DPEC_G00068310 [Dallia pectoralis]